MFRRRCGLFLDLEHNAPLDLIENTKTAAFELWLHRLPDRGKVKLVFMDFGVAARENIGSVLSNADAVIDKRHALLLGEDALILSIKQWLPCLMDPEKVKHLPRYFFESFRELLQSSASHSLETHQKSLSQKISHGKIALNAEKMQLLVYILRLTGIRSSELFLVQEPVLAAVLKTKDEFDNIWRSDNRKEAERLYVQWKKRLPSAASKFGQVIKTIEERKNEIFNCFDFPAFDASPWLRDRISKSIHRAGRGYDFPALRAKTLLTDRSCGEAVVCEMCSGHFYSSMSLEASHLVPKSDHDKQNSVFLCQNCHARFSTKSWFKPFFEKSEQMKGPSMTK
jgi:hypothetical protein